MSNTWLDRVLQETKSSRNRNLAVAHKQWTGFERVHFLGYMLTYPDGGKLMGKP